jgi:predicted CXXCH cytochrome family protein
MIQWRSARRSLWLLLVLPAMLTLGVVQIASAQEPVPSDATLSIPNETCLACHRQHDMEWVLPSGEILPVYVDSDQLAASVHTELSCQDCHSDIAGYPHGEPPIDDHRDLQVYYSQSCANCHTEQALAQVDSVHAQVRAAGIDEAAVCIDCHGSHAIQPISHTKHPDVPATAATETCQQCHSGIHEQFVDSVHGEALFAGGEDVPGCTYCHPAHTAEDPRTVEFRLNSPQICGSCHADKELMAQYGISTEVFDTYVADFHGTTVMLFEQTHPDQPTNKAVCIDCHGVHNIANTEDTSALKENLLARCQECHPDATANFASSWLGHYAPNWDNAPLVTAVTWFYRILIPAVVVFFVVYIALDAQRRYRDRRAQRKEAQA